MILMSKSKKNQFILKLNFAVIFLLFITSAVGVNAQTVKPTRPATSTIDTSSPEYIKSETDKYNALINPPNQYSNLSQEEYDKLPLSAKLPGDINEQVSVTVFPEIPRPGDTVTISVDAFGGIDINSAQINWVMNGKSVLKGAGEKKFAFQAGSDGKTITIELRIKPVYGPEIVKTYKFNPSEVDVLWQANTYTPPFYRGKALYTPEADVQFVAMPNILKSNKTNLQPNGAVYNWNVDFKNYADKSGFGKNTYYFSGSILTKPTNVRVTAYDPSKKESTGVGSIEVGPTEPKLLMYEDHPTYGPLFSTAAVGNYNFGAQDIKLNAYPYFFSVASKHDADYVWKINGTDLKLPLDQDFVTLQKLKQESGKSTISVHTSLNSKVLQQTDTTLSLSY